MPKTVDESVKISWYESYENGKSVKQIAKDADRDVRTVNKAINEIRMRREAGIARVDMVSNALRKHQDYLLDNLKQIGSSLNMPNMEQPYVEWYGWENTPVAKGNLDLEIAERGIASSFLKSHLKGDRLWQDLSQRQKVLHDFRQAQTYLQKKVADLLEENTTLPLLSKGVDGTLFVYTYTTGDLTYKTAVQRVLGLNEEPNIESQILLNLDLGQVQYLGQPLAEARGQEQQTMDGIIKTIQDIANSSETKTVVRTYNGLRKSTENIQELLEGIIAVGMIPGLCDICQRLGLR